MSVWDGYIALPLFAMAIRLTEGQRQTHCLVSFSDIDS